MTMYAESHNSLFTCTLGVGADPVNQGRITRRSPGFDIQVNPVNVLSDRDA